MSITTKRFILGAGGALLFALGSSFAAQAGGGYGGPYGFGAPVDEAELAKINIDVMPDGRGAPEGSGTYEEGMAVYADNCAACHGEDMASPVKGTGAAALRGGRGSLDSGTPNKTVESYWPYASTVFDYVKRAMPFDAPGSLSDDEVYAVVAYILAEGEIIDKDTPVSASNIGTIEMPNRNGFVPDPRPDVYNYE
ncbi:MAG: cytochrome c [Kiloniellales bacterium]|jgi:mono/diheme cytochrome c family protein|nr:cytochrome c [Kiloniellales bacterium]